MEDCLKWLDKQCVVGLVGGSDLKKISEQMSIGNQSGQYLRRSYEMGGGGAKDVVNSSI